MNKKTIFKKLNNSGAGIVTVIVAVALISILASIVLTGSYMNYKVKQTNLKSRDSFYSAETALDEVNIGLQNLVSQAISSAYMAVLEDYSRYDDEKKNEQMAYLFYEKVWNDLQLDSTHSTYDVSKLNLYIPESSRWDGSSGVLITSSDPAMVTYEGLGVVLKNITVYYRDSQGYSTTIRTDIRLVCPTMQFGTATTLPNVGSYALVADEKFQIGSGTNNVAGVTIKGEFYTGQLVAETAAGTSINASFEGVGNFVSQENISLKNANVSFSESATLWTKSILLNSSTVSLKGTTNLSNDLVLNGNGSKAIVKKRYNGYGNSITDANESSAILINGSNSTLDFSAVERITIAGHAFVGTKAHNKGSISGGSTGNGSNVMMGESISVKSNQVMYLVPAECIGVRKSVADGVTTYLGSAYKQNPLTASQYQEIVNHSDSYIEIRDNLIVDSLNHDLAYYFDGSSPTYEKVFVQSNSGETLVYYYIRFENEDQANRYFRDYYAINEDSIDNYLKFYTSAITVPSAANLVSLQLAGNLLKYDGTDSTLESNTLSSSSLSGQATLYASQMDALCLKLITNYSELGSNLKYSDRNTVANVVFDNIVDTERFTEFIAAQGEDSPRRLNFTNATGTVKAVLIDNAGISAYVYNGSDTAINLIIATGDVEIRANYKGLIMANGKVTIYDNVTSVEANESLAREAMRLEKTFGTSTYPVFAFFRDGANIVNAGNAAIADQSLKLSDLVVYENWSKN